MNTNTQAFKQLIDSIIEISQVESKITLTDKVLRKRVTRYVDYILTDVVTYNPTILKQQQFKGFIFRAKGALTKLGGLGTKRKYGYAWTRFQSDINLLVVLNKGNNYTGKASTFVFNVKYQKVIKTYAKSLHITALFPNYDKFIKQSQELIAVDVDNMKQLLNKEQACKANDRRLSKKSLLQLKLLIYVAEQNNDRIPHYFEEATTGRIYYKGLLNLQNIKKLIRYTAIPSCYVYDLQAASYSLIAAHAKQIDTTIDTSVIDDYVKNRKQIRKLIAKDIFGVSFEGEKTAQIKEALTAIGFNARLQTLNLNTSDSKATLALDDIFKTQRFGNEKVKRFIANEQVQRLVNCLNSLNEMIYEHYKAPSNSIEICTGFAFDRIDDKGKKKSKSKLLAHVYQSLERKALDILITHAGNSLILSLHDGILSKEKLDIQAIQRDLQQLLDRQTPLDIDVRSAGDILTMAQQHKVHMADEDELARHYSGYGYSSQMTDLLENFDTTTYEGKLIAALNKNEKTMLEQVMAMQRKQ